jgi:Protein of unknown function (DUF4240)
MKVEEFWRFLERSGRETASPQERTRWLEHRLGRIARTHVVDFHIHLDTLRRPVDTYAMWGAAYQIMAGFCSGDGFWYFQPWLIGQGQHWYQHAARNPDNLADIPVVQALAVRSHSQWANAEWPEWEELAYVARRVHDHVTGQQDSIYDALDARDHHSPSGRAPTDQTWDFDNTIEIQQRLPRLARLFPRGDSFKD